MGARVRIRIVTLAILGMCVLIGASSALADDVDDLVATLRKDPDDKVRLSAAISLGKLKDQRAVGPLTDALSDHASKVRLVAAVVLGKLVDASVPMDVRNRAIDELERVANDDPEDSVRTQADRSWNLVKAYRGGVVKPPPSTSGNDNNSTKQAPAAARLTVYVDLTGFKDGTKKASTQLVTGMRGAAEATYLQMAWVTRWSGGKSPSQTDLAKAQMAGFYLDVKLTTLSVAKDGEVTCRAYGEIGLYPRDKKIVQLGVWQPASTWSSANAGRRAKDIEQAKARCVSDLAAKMASDSIPLITKKTATGTVSSATATVRGDED